MFVSEVHCQWHSCTLPQGLQWPGHWRCRDLAKSGRLSLQSNQKREQCSGDLSVLDQSILSTFRSGESVTAMFSYCSAPPVARSAPPQHACDSMGFRSWALALVVSWHDACRRGPVRYTNCDPTLWVWQVISNLSVRNPMQHNNP